MTIKKCLKVIDNQEWTEREGGREGGRERVSVCERVY
jgi:hypothetical protein